VSPHAPTSSRIHTLTIPDWFPHPPPTPTPPRSTCRPLTAEGVLESVAVVAVNRLPFEPAAPTLSCRQTMFAAVAAAALAPAPEGEVRRAQVVREGGGAEGAPVCEHPLVCCKARRM